MNYKTTIDICHIDYNGIELTIGYEFAKAELGYYDGTGTFDGVEIRKVFTDNVDVTPLLNYELVKDLEKIVLDNHSGNL
mgnify:CR=1 FL=1